MITRTVQLIFAVGLALGLAVTTAPSASAAPSAGTTADGSALAQARDRDGDNIDPVSGQEVERTSVVQYINAAYIWFAFIGGLLAIIMLIYAGYTYMGSYGDPEKISNAKDIVEKTLIGLALLILAALILSTINPRTTDPCRPGERGCGDIDFTRPGG
ncbi:MAG: pilin [Patescibacteria group bacterium]